MENTIVNTYGSLCDRDDIVRDFDWKKILVPSILQSTFIPDEDTNKIDFYEQFGNKRIAVIIADKKFLSIHPLLYSEQRDYLISELHFALNIYYHIGCRCRVETNNSLTKFVVSFYGDEIIKQKTKPESKQTLKTDNKNRNKDVVYVELPHGVIFKIDIKGSTGYRFNQKKEEWNYDGLVYCEYEYGELGGKAIDFDDHYPIGEPFEYQP